MRTVLRVGPASDERMLELVTEPSQILHRIVESVLSFDQALKQNLVAAAEIMYLHDGVGLAAPQVGLSQRFILIDPSGGEESSQLIELVNPEVTWRSSESILGPEGCLSLPGVELNVLRSCSVEVSYFNVRGEPCSMRLEGYASRILQHEVDHLDGITMLDKVGSLSRKLALKSLSRSR